jgi:hypothetical protein
MKYHSHVTQSKTPDWEALSNQLERSRFYYMPAHKITYCKEPLNSMHPKLPMLGFKQRRDKNGKVTGMYHPNMKTEATLGAIVHPIEKGFSRLEDKLPIPTDFPKLKLFQKFQKLYQEPSQ